jgi:hypothetical protein
MGVVKLLANFDSLGYYCVRFRFILMNNLEKDFRFDLYLKKQLQHLFIEVIEIQWQTWIVAFPLALISYVVRDAITPSVPSAVSIVVFFTIVSFIPALISLTVNIS